VQQDAPDELLDGLQPVIEAAEASITIVFAGSPALLKRTHVAGRFCPILDIRKHVILRCLQVLSAINPKFHCPRLMAGIESNNFDAALDALPTQMRGKPTAWPKFYATLSASAGSRYVIINTGANTILSIVIEKLIRHQNHHHRNYKVPQSLHHHYNQQLPRSQKESETTHSTCC